MRKVSLTIKNGSAVCAQRGYVTVTGVSVAIFEKPADGDPYMLYAYCLQPGESVRGNEKGEYVVQF